MTDVYVSPLVERFATSDMKALWSAQKKFSTWRRCWVALAEAEPERGLLFGVLAVFRFFFGGDTCFT